MRRIHNKCVVRNTIKLYATKSLRFSKSFKNKFEYEIQVQIYSLSISWA